MKYLTLTLLALLIPSALLAISIARADWEIVCGTEHMGGIYTLESDGNRLYAGAENGVYLSDDDGHTWRLTLPGSIRTIAIDTDNVYTFLRESGAYGMYRSDDRGETWTPIHGALPKYTTTNNIRGTVEKRLPIIEQLLPTSSGTLIAAGYSDAHISHDQGETWKDVYHDWVIRGHQPWGLANNYVLRRNEAMAEFGGYWWIATRDSLVYRSPDKGESWEAIHLSDNFLYGDRQWAAVGDQLYLTNHEGVARWNEAEGVWDDVSRGLLPSNDRSLLTLGGHDSRLFAARPGRGVYMYDAHFNRWIASGLDGLHVNTLVSHNSKLYAAASVTGFSDTLYRGSMLSVRPYSKAPTTWGAIKQRGRAK